MKTAKSPASEASAEYYKSLVHSMDDGFCILELIMDEQGRPVDLEFADTNLAFEEQSGAQNAQGRRLSEVVPEAGRHWVDRLADVVRTGATLRLPNEKGSKGRRFDITATRIGGPGSRCVGVVFRNVTEHVRSAEALKRTEERYRTLFESIDEGFCIVEMIYDEAGRVADYKFLETNPCFERQTGLHDAVGQTMRSLVPNHDAHWFEIYGEVVASGEAIRFQKEARAMGRWYDVYAFPTSEPAQVAVLFDDITERIRTQERLLDADRRKDEFLAMLAHELRNPLAPIGAAAELLERSAFDETLVKRASEIIRRQVRHMTDLVDDLLDVSRVTRGLVTLDKVPVDVKRVLSEAMEQVRPLMQAKDHAVAMRAPPESARVLGDHTRLVQVFTNLLNNAAKYTPSGGSIGIDLRVAGGQVEIAVTDNGIGLAPEFLAPAFDLFAQAERSSDRAQGGLGIGLALVKSLVELHGGSASAASEGLGYGATFTVRLPQWIDPPSEAKGEDKPGTQAPHAGALKVMVVDDNVDAAETLAMLIETMGHEAIVEHGWRKALERSRREALDIFLLDVGLPEVDGHELARRLRAQPETAGAVLAAVTGYGREQDRAAALQAGFDHHFVKPVGPESLRRLFDKVGKRGK